MAFRNCALVVLLTFSISGCGGGSEVGSISAPIEFSSFSDVPNEGVVSLNGVALSTHGSEKVEAKIQYHGDSIHHVSISGDATHISAGVSEEGGYTVRGAGVGSGFVRLASRDSYVLLADPRDSNFDYQTFGYWDSSEGSNNIGAGSFGVRTDMGTVSGETTATYNGKSRGVLRSNQGDYETRSNLRLETDFSNVTIRSSNTKLYENSDQSRYQGEAPELDFEATGSISDSGFSALIQEQGASGSVTGHFYGPNAAEVGGTFETTGSGGTNIGAFGAIQ